MRRFCCCGLIPFSLLETTLDSKKCSRKSTSVQPFRPTIFPDHQPALRCAIANLVCSMFTCLMIPVRSDALMSKAVETRRRNPRHLPASFIRQAEPSGIDQACQVFFPSFSRRFGKYKQQGSVAATKVTGAFRQLKPMLFEQFYNFLFLAVTDFHSHCAIIHQEPATILSC